MGKEVFESSATSNLYHYLVKTIEAMNAVSIEKHEGKEFVYLHPVSVPDHWDDLYTKLCSFASELRPITWDEVFAKDEQNFEITVNGYEVGYTSRAIALFEDRLCRNSALHTFATWDAGEVKPLYSIERRDYSAIKINGFVVTRGENEPQIEVIWEAKTANHDGPDNWTTTYWYHLSFLDELPEEAKAMASEYESDPKPTAIDYPAESVAALSINEAKAMLSQNMKTEESKK